MLLALMGTAYISSARQERYAASVGAGQLVLREAVESQARSVVAEVSSLISKDSGNLITSPSSAVTATQMLAGRQPILLPDLAGAGPATVAGVTNIPVWPVISRWQSQKFESPLIDPLNPSKPNQYQWGSNTYFAPTNIVIHYGSGYAGTDPSLYGQTRVFPAFYLYTPDAPSNLTQYRRFGPYLAGDATSMGIATSGLFPLGTTEIQGVRFYGAIHVVDNADAFNLNTSWDRGQDLDPNGNCLNFFPCDLDWFGAMNGVASTTATPTEMQYVNSFRWDNRQAAALKSKANTYVPVNSPLIDDKNLNHGDVAYLNSADAFWMNLGRRTAYPNGYNLFGDATNNYGRAYGDADTAALAWHGGLVDLDNPLSRIDGQLFQMNGTDSVFAGAANCFANAQNRFRYFGANNVGYWYDWYYNFEGFPSTANPTLQFPIANPPTSNGQFKTTSYNGPAIFFRSNRPMLVGANPVANLAAQVDHASLPQTATQVLAGPAHVVPGDTQVGLVHPSKTSLNTADFPHLWRAFINVLGGQGSADPTTGKIAFSVPGYLPNDPALDPGIFRNVLRGPNTGITLSKPPLPPGINDATDPKVELFDSANVLLLRAAEAAVNVMTLREGHGYNPNGTTYFIPDPVREPINLVTKKGKKVQVLVYGATANPYIGEVYANTDQTDHGGNANDSGYVAVKLYNPYPFPIDLSDYAVVLVDRNSTGSYPAMSITKLDSSSFSGKSIAANGVVVLTNFGSATPKTKYQPASAGTLPGGTQTLLVSDLHKVMSDPGTPAQTGGELVLLRRLVHGGNSTVPEVPVDCYDFTGLALNGVPPTDPPKDVTIWHYVRTTGNTTPANRWKCVNPGVYDATRGNGTPGKPRFIETRVYTQPADQDPTLKPAAALDAAEVTSTYTQSPNYNGIQLCNADMGGFNKYTQVGKRVFPFGGFARVGDVIQAPFIGSYVVESTPQTVALFGLQKGLTADRTAVMEMNPVTVDTCFADDGDDKDDKIEQIGRFVPIDEGKPDNTSNALNDYWFGRYRDPDVNAANQPVNTNLAKWHYHFALAVTEQFTTVSNPESDYFPNIEPTAWHGTVPPEPVVNTPGTINNPNTQNEYATEGRINLNSASWRTLAAIEMIPRSVDTNGSLNAKLAKLIVRYRDVDDGVARVNQPPQGHGPFKSLMELNKVFDPVNPVNTFRNGLGAMTLPGDPSDPTVYQWGNYVPGPGHFPLTGPNKDADNLPVNDYIPYTLMVTRVSNMLTLRSDSFTAYVLVQGWRNAGTNFPELVIQKRLAVILDRSALGTSTTGTAASYTVPAD